MLIESRVVREQQSYDSGAVFAANSRIKERFRHVFDCPNTLFCERYVENRIRSRVKGGRVLDYGCGAGPYSGRLLSLGAAHVVGIDISPRNIEEARLKFTNTSDAAEFHIMDGHKLAFPDGIFDAVVGRGVLHHLNFETAVLEIRRVLKKGGIAVFNEPQRDNPAAKIYRWLTPHAHTLDELPLSRKQIEWADHLFASHDHVFCGFFSTALAMLTSQVISSADNKLLRVADLIDRRIMRTPLRYWMRYAYLVWEK